MLLSSGQIEVVHVEFPSFCKQWIVHIGDVAHALDRAPGIDQTTNEYVVGDERKRVTKVCGVVRRHAADVHLYFIARNKVDDVASCRVVEAHALG